MRSRSRCRRQCPRLTPAVYCAFFKKKSKSKRRRRRRSSRPRRKRRVIRRKSRRCVSKRRRTKRHRPLWARITMKKCGRCGMPGPKTTNPFLNFMRVFRRKRCGWAASRIAIEGAKLWCRMSRRDKMRFYREACALRKKKHRRKGHGRRRSGSKRRRRSGC